MLRCFFFNLRDGVENLSTGGGVSLLGLGEQSEDRGNPPPLSWAAESRPTGRSLKNVFRLLAFPQGYFASRLFWPLTETDAPPPPGRSFWLLACARSQLWSWHRVHLLDWACVSGAWWSSAAAQVDARHTALQVWLFFLRRTSSNNNAGLWYQYSFGVQIQSTSNNWYKHQQGDGR